MAIELNNAVVRIRVLPERESWNELTNEIQNIWEELQTKFAEIWRSVEKEYNKFLAGAAQDVVKSWDDAEKSLKSTARGALRGTIVSIFKGEMNGVEGIWSRAWDQMFGKLEATLDGFLTRTVDRAFTGLESIFLKTVWDPLSDQVFGGLGPNPLSGLRSAVESLGSGASAPVIGSYLHSLSPALGNWWFGGSALEVGAGMSAVGEGLGAAGAGASAEFGLSSLAPAASGAPGGLSTGLGAALLSPAGMMGAALAPGLAGMMMSQMDIFGWGQMTPQDARERIQAQLEFVQRYTQAIQDLADPALSLGSQAFSLFGEAAREAAAELERNRELAGYTSEQIEALVAATGPLGEAFLESGRAAYTLEQEVGGLVQQMNASINSFTFHGQEALEFERRIAELGERLGLTGEALREFRDRIFDMAEGFSHGGEEAAVFGAAMDQFLGDTLSSLTAGVDQTAQSMRDLTGAIQGIPTEWETTIKVTRTGEDTFQGQIAQAAAGPLGLGGGPALSNADLGYYHAGGVVGGLPRYHAGDIIGSLALDEVPIIARRGEYLVRAESVTAVTLPTLRAINAGGRAAAPSVPVVNLHLEIHGNLWGSEDNLEDLARLIEDRLRGLQASRWRA